MHVAKKDIGDHLGGALVVSMALYWSRQLMVHIIKLEEHKTDGYLQTFALERGFVDQKS